MFLDKVKTILFNEVEINGANTGTTNTGIIDHAEFWYVHDRLKFLVGNPKGSVYGWRQKLDGPHDFTGSASAGISPWGRTDTVQVSYDLQEMGEFTYQIAKDVYWASGSTFESFNDSTADSNAFTYQWMGTFSGFTPLLQYATYDSTHSNTFTAGLRYQQGMLDLRLDYITDNRWRMVGTEEGEDKITGMNIEVYYTMGEVELFGLYSTYNNEEHTATGASEVKVNSAVGTYDDNKVTSAVGFTYLGIGKGFKPYAAYIMDSGKFTDSTNEEATFNENIIKVGVKGNF